ncbi:MAG: ChaB family protein [Syntrophobacteraceae bacterium]
MYTTENPPEFLKGLAEGAQKIGIAAFNAVYAREKDEDQARMACWAAIKAKFEKSESGEWRAKQAEETEYDFRASVGMQPGGGDLTGLVWEAVLIAPGPGHPQSNPRYFWDDEVLARGAQMFQGVDVNAYDATPKYLEHMQLPGASPEQLFDAKRYLTSKKVGWVDKAWHEPGVGIKGIIKFLPEGRWVPRSVQQGINMGNGEVLGLSIDSRVCAVPVDIDGRTMLYATQFKAASSVDVVTRPAAGGKFLRAIQGLQEESLMKDQLLKLIQEKRPELLAGKDMAALTDAEVMALARQAIEVTEKRADQGLPPLTAEEIDARIKAGLQEQEQRAACGQMLTTGLAESELPDLARARIRTNFSSRIFEPKELEEAIKGEREYLAQMVNNFGGPQGWGDQVRTSGGLGQRDKIEMAIDQVFGLTGEDVTSLSAMRRLDGKPFFEGMRAAQDYDVLKGVALPGSIREIYTMLTGDLEVGGFFNRKNLPADLRAAQDITSLTFGFVMGNTLARRLVKDYMLLDYGENMLISISKAVKDFKTQEAVLVGYFGDLSTVDPEAADYAEIAPVTDEEATYAILQRGNILTITRKAIINDDLSVIQRLVSRLGRAARRTHAKYVWNFFINNTNCSDGTAWFTAPHANLGALALSITTALAAYTALAGMTEKDSGELIGHMTDGVQPTLVYPIGLMPTAESIVNDEYYFTANDLTTKTRNPLRGKIKGRYVPIMTDTNDWGLLLPPAVVDMVEMGYLNGRQEPEMFLADSPQAEQVFVADKLRYKIRHEYAGTVIDYRSGYKAEVA